jgi:hypothetical protein
MDKYIRVIIFVWLTTVLLTYSENKSNLPTEYIIPFIVVILTKYFIGDLENNINVTYINILYWSAILIISYGTLYIFKNR